MAKDPVSAVVTDDELRVDAEDATSWEHRLTARRALKVYSKAVWWSVVLSLAIIMEGFDTKIMSQLFAQPAFQETYGHQAPDGSYQISAAWQSGLSAMSGVASVLGMFIGGFLTERFGFRFTMMAALLAMPAPNFAYFFAPSLEVLLVATLLMGLPLGIFQTITTVYAAEVMPTCLRPYLTSFVSFVWAIGQLLCAVVLRGTLHLPGSWSYRVPFALQWVWPVFLFIGAYLAPESPWWLVRQDRLEEAEMTLKRLTSDDLDIEPNKLISLMVFTTSHEREVDSRTSYIGCFSGTNLLRTISCLGVYTMQVITGSTLRSYMTYFFQQAGLPTDQSFNMTIVGLTLAVLGVLGSWILMNFLGRRTMYLLGLAISIALFTSIGGLGVELGHSHSAALSWAVGSLLMVDAFVADFLVLPVTFSLVSEIPSSLLRSKTVVVARSFYTVVNIVAGTITPYMLNPTAWAWGAKTGFFWAGACVLGFVFTFFVIPEPKGRTTAEMDILFERGVPIRKFRGTKVELTDVVEGK